MNDVMFIPTRWVSNNFKYGVSKIKFSYLPKLSNFAHHRIHMEPGKFYSHLSLACHYKSFHLYTKETSLIRTGEDNVAG